jgi:hypothetical protein
MSEINYFKKITIHDNVTDGLTLVANVSYLHIYIYINNYIKLL